MEIKELIEFAKEDTKRLKEKFGYEDKEFVRTNMIKLTEEIGELSQEILKKFGYQRKKEMTSELANEIADMIIVTTILAESIDIDIETALKEKFEKIRNREK